MLEVPSGVWADAVSRRALLTLAPLLSGAGFGLWVLAPSYEAFALGFVLWGAQGALQSGALEALVYEELERTGAEGRYPRLMGRATALGTIAGGRGDRPRRPRVRRGRVRRRWARPACWPASRRRPSARRCRSTAQAAAGAVAATRDRAPGCAPTRRSSRPGRASSAARRALRGAVLLCPRW